MNILDRIKNGITKDADNNKYKHFIAKVFGLANEIEESKDLDNQENNYEEEFDNHDENQDKMYKEIHIIKTLLLDLSNITKCKT